MNTVTVPRSFYLKIAETAAQHEGMLSGRRVVQGKPYDRPGDLLGTVLSETWLIDPALVGLVAGAYVTALREECADHGATAPTVDVVLKAIPYAIDDGRYPTVDVDRLSRVLAADVPGVIG